MLADSPKSKTKAKKGCKGSIIRSKKAEQTAVRTLMLYMASCISKSKATLLVLTILENNMKNVGKQKMNSVLNDTVACFSYLLCFVHVLMRLICVRHHTFNA